MSMVGQRQAGKKLPGKRAAVDAEPTALPPASCKQRSENVLC